MSAKVWMEKTWIPTYAVGAPDKNPMFLERRVYQGSSGKVYPHTVIDTVADEKTPREYTALCMENEYLYIMVLPELGGRVQRALDKTNGYDFVYYNHVIKPAMVGLAGPWISGGIEFNWPQHHRPSTFDPVQWKIEENADGSVSILVGEIETMFRTKGMSRLTLRPGRAYLEIENQLFNRTEQPQTFLWWANPAVAVNRHTRSIFPPDVYAVMDHGKRDVSDFPIAHGVYYKTDYSAGVDISRYCNIPVPTSYMAYHSDFDFVGNYDEEKQAGMLHVADHHLSPGKKQWTWGCGEFGQAWDRNLTDDDGPYIELMTGCYTDNQPDFAFLMPQEEKRFTQFFMPYKRAGSVKNATKEAMIGLERGTEQTEVVVYATARYADATVTVRSEEQILLCERTLLSPENAYVGRVNAGAALLSVVVRDEAGRELVSYREVAQAPREMPLPAEAIPDAAALESTEKLFLAGQHIEQYRHATLDAADYYVEGLRRDPTDTRLNNAYGKLLFKRGLVAQSERSFREAVKAATAKNPNPYDGECYYNWGVALDRLNRADEAYDAFLKAAWNYAWCGAAYERAGIIDMRQKRWALAEDHLRRALDANARNMEARDALMIALRVQGRADEALTLAEETLRLDPLNGVASRERSLLTQEKETWMDTIGDNPNPYIELALEYARCGAARDAAAVLSSCPRAYPMIGYHLAHLTKDAAWAERAEAFCPDGCFPHRVEDCEALEYALSLRPEAAVAHYALGNYWYDKGQYDRAISHWEKAAASRPAFATAHRNLALAYYNKRGNPEAALREMEIAFACDTDDARVLMELDQLRKKLHHSAQSRLDMLKRYLPLVQSRDDLALEYATLLNTLGRYQDALQWINSRRFHPWEGGEGKAPAQWRIALIMLAREQMARREYQAALPLLRQAAGPYPEHLGEGRLPATRENDAQYWIGRCYEALADTSAARAAYADAAKGDSKPSGMAYYNDQPPEMILYQGLARERLGDTEGAVDCFAGLRAYAARHRDDDVRTEFFAVSLPELQIFNEDLSLRNRIHCLLLDALGALGQRKMADARAALNELERLFPEHQGARIHAWPLLKEDIR